MGWAYVSRLVYGVIAFVTARSLRRRLTWAGPLPGSCAIFHTPFKIALRPFQWVVFGYLYFRYPSRRRLIYGLTPLPPTSLGFLGPPEASYGSGTVENRLGRTTTITMCKFRSKLKPCGASCVFSVWTPFSAILGLLGPWEAPNNPFSSIFIDLDRFSKMLKNASGGPPGDAKVTLR